MVSMDKTVKGYVDVRMEHHVTSEQGHVTALLVGRGNFAT